MHPYDLKPLNFEGHSVADTMNYRQSVPSGKSTFTKDIILEKMKKDIDIHKRMQETTPNIKRCL